MSGREAGRMHFNVVTATKELKEMGGSKDRLAKER